MHDTVDLSYQVDRAAAAQLLRARRAAIRDAWYQIVVEGSHYNTGITPPLLDAYLEGFANYVERPDSAIPASIAGVWTHTLDMNIDAAAATAVTMVQLGQALRDSIGTDRSRASQETVEIACAAMPDFDGGFVRAMMNGGERTPVEQHWYEVSQQLAEEREHRITQLAILNEVSTALASTLSLDALYQTIYEQVSRLIDTTYFYIGTLGPGLHEMEMGLLYYGAERMREREGRPVRMGLTRVVVDRMEPLIFDDYYDACRLHEVEPVSDIQDSLPLAWLGVPIVAGSKAIGIMAVMSPRGPFDADDAEILAAVARQAGAAIQNARSFAAQMAQANQLRAINKISRAFATIRDPWSLMNEAVRLIREHFGYSVVTIFTTLPEDERLALKTQTGLENGDDLLGMTLRIGEQGIVGHAAALRAPVLSNDVLTDPHYVRTAHTEHIRSEIAVPLLREDVLLGVLDIESPQSNAFSQDDLDVLTTVADQLAVALENADLFVQERKRRTELALILEASQAANSSLVLDDVIQHVAEGIADAIGLPSCVIYLYDEEGDRLLPSAFVARDGSLLDTTRVSQVIPSTETSQLLRRIFLAGHEASAIEMMSCEVDDELTRVLSPSAVLAVPFVSKHQFLGLALLISHDAEYHFSSHQLRVAYGVAGSAALALENARLYTRSHSLGMAEERIRVARDIHDGIAQSLTAISLNLEAAESLMGRKPEKAQSKIVRALELARGTLDDARRSVLDLRASALQELTLTDAVERRLQQFVRDAEQQAKHVTNTFASDAMYGRLSSRLELSLYRIFEAALDNVEQHSNASHVGVTLAREGDDVILTVRDNGRGFDVDSVLAGHQPGNKFGLVAIRERVRLLHGNLHVRSDDGQGTYLQVTVPFEPFRGAAADEPGEAVPLVSVLLTEDGEIQA
jgi:signal transduction histidine kinase